MRTYLRTYVTILLLVLNSPLWGAWYEVAQRHPNANDEGPGSPERPWKTISRATKERQPGDVVVIRDGTYRERVLIKSSGTASQPIKFQAAPGSNVLVTGADQCSGWKRMPGPSPVYTIPWPHRFITWSKQMTHPDDEYHRLIGRSEQVAVENYLLRQVLDVAQMVPGTFLVDTSNQVLQVWDAGSRDLNKVPVEASVRTEVVRVEGEYVQLRGLHFRYAANMAQHGAVALAGAHDIMEDCVIENMNASGAAFSAAGQTIRRCVFRDNGQLGFGANGAHELLFTECLVENNNTKGYDRGWEAGGDKLALCRDAVLERSRFVRNRGNGIWFDIGNEHCAVRQCLIADNEDAGIFYEISFGLQAADNVITGNGFAATPGAWGAQAGISLSSSPECVVERNLILGNREGFNFREQARSTPRIGVKGDQAVWNHDQVIRNNVIAFNRDAQIWGWFDMKDNRHWPSPEGRAPRVPNKEHSNSQQVRDSTGVPPKSLTLEALRLQFEDNVYWAAPGQGLFQWGTSWGRHEAYTNLLDFQTQLKIDVGSRVVDPGFTDLISRDYRVPPATLGELEKTYPRGPIPGAVLGSHVPIAKPGK